MLGLDLQTNLGTTPTDLIGERMRVFNTLTDLINSGSIWIGMRVRTLGYYSIGDGGDNEYIIVAGGTGTADGGEYVNLTTSGYQANGLFPGKRVNARQYGATGDGSTDDTTELNNMMLYCRDNNISWHLPDGAYRVSSQVTAYTSGYCDGYLVKTNNGFSGTVFDVDTLAADITAITAATINTWTGMHKGSSIITGAGSYQGQFIYIDTPDETLIGRWNAADLDQGDSFIVDDDTGRIAPALYSDWALSLTSVTAEAKKIQQKVTIENLKVILDGSGATESGVGITCSRSNTVFKGCAIINNSDAPLRVGFNTQKAALVTYENCTVDGIDVNVTNYGFNSDLCSYVYHINCNVTKARRGVDATRCKNVTVTGGNYQMGIGAHYAWNFTAEDVVLGSTNSINDHCLHVAGGNVTVKNCELNVNRGGAQAFNMRADIMELGGHLILEGNRIIFDDTSDALGSGDAYLVDLGGNTNAYDTVRKVYWPSFVSITNNTIIQKGSPSDTRIRLLVVGMNSTSANVPRDIEMSGSIIIDDNNFELDGGVTTSGGNKRLYVQTLKPATVVGDGYKITIKKLPVLETYIFAQSTRVDANQRHDFYIEDVASASILSASYGAYRRIQVRRMGTFTKTQPGGTGGYTAIGDEYLGEQNDARMGVRQNVTIATGVLTVSNNVGRFFEVEGEGAAADDLVTITSTFDEGALIVLTRGANNITVKHGTGNIFTATAADVVLTTTTQTVTLIKTSADTWLQI